MRTKQTLEEIVKNFADVEKSLLPSVLLGTKASTPSDLVKIESSQDLIRAYMLRHFTDAQGVTDFSFQNIRITIFALKDQLPWQVAPKKRPSDAAAAEQARRENRQKDPSGVTGLAKAFGDAVQTASAAVDAKILKECQGLVETASSTYHSATAELRRQLKEKFDGLLLAKTPPAQIQKTLKDLRDNFSPRLRRV